jgi:hypothetical protein
MISQLVRATALVLVCAAGAPGTADARTVYDGNWSVLIVTERGNCDRAYRYGVEIENGRVIYRGGGPDFNGRVSPNGSVQVRVSAGSQNASGSGRLSRTAGRGSWRGQSTTGACSGYWEAERRG